MKKYFVNKDGSLGGEVLVDNPANPLGLLIVSVESLPAPMEHCRWDGKSIVANLGWQTEVLNEAKTFKRNEINTLRDTKEVEGFPYLGKVFDSDARSVQRITVAAQAAQVAKAAGQPFNIVWTAKDNSTVELSADQMIAMPVAIAEYANSLHVTAAGLKA